LRKLFYIRQGGNAIPYYITRAKELNAIILAHRRGGSRVRAAMLSISFYKAKDEARRDNYSESLKILMKHGL